MKKKLISLAVAAAMVAPAAAMAEAIIYGKLHVSIDYADVKNAAGVPTFNPVTGRQTAAGTDFEGWGVNRNGNGGSGWGLVGPVANPNVPFAGSGASGGYMPGAGPSNRIGIKGSEDIGNGLKAIYQVELGIAFGASDANIPSGNNNSFSVRNSFVGLAGSFGTVLVGRHDTPLKISTGKLDMFADTMADYNGTVGFNDLRVDNAIAYISPSFSGFQFMGALVAPGGATAGEGLNANSDQLNGAWSLAGIYNNGPYYASIAYESLNSEMFMDTGASNAVTAGINEPAVPATANLATGVVTNPVAAKSFCTNPAGNLVAGNSCSSVSSDYNKWRFGLGILDWNGFSLSAIYENQDNIPGGQTYSQVVGGVAVPNNIESQELWQIQAGYAFGNNQIKAMYGEADRDYGFNSNLLPAAAVGTINQVKAWDGDRSTWAIAFDHNFSKRTKAYVMYTDVEDDLENYVAGSEWSGFSMGMIHSF
ncbi:porin [Thiorhodovibrio frisius]|uniref:Outer membrane protein (Porin) n=1 Tax=Thiorhodovibrio frisius TaxID=631362 RepID=H8YZ20_9GAMM|nr:porin [Thiorhodovibrio frisius]EIC21947.1 outer membrane protein (porin) [Thiorhodovibrio frisius]WPL24236.1 Porin [Thiorhodovibrio frisius]